MYNHTGALLLQTAFLVVVNHDIPPLPDVMPANFTWEQIKKGEDPGAVCYDGLGCYPVSYPWTDETRPVSNYPEHPDKVDPVFCLYTREHQHVCHRLRYNVSSTIFESKIVPTHRTYILAHGFLENGDKRWLKVLKDRFLNRTDCNVIVIGWQGGSSPPYTQAVANIRLVGRMGGHLLGTLNRLLGLKTEFCHVIGHSLGAHLAGYIGHTLNTHYNLSLGRISALDPAKPHFSKTDPIVRLDPTDALFVDVIHTNAELFIQRGMGMDEPVGHLDFYPNGGEVQPGCSKSLQNTWDAEEGFIKAVRRFLGCHHVRSYEYYLESIPDRCEFMAVECDTWENFLAGKCFGCKSEINPNGRICAKMGLRSVRAIQKFGAETGNIHPNLPMNMIKLFTITGSKYPYCRYLYRITLRISSSNESLAHGGEVGTFSLQIIGVKGKTEVIRLFKEKAYQPGTIHTEVIASTTVGRVRTGVLHWSHEISINMLTWRWLLPTIHVANITIDSLEEASSITLCPVKEEIKKERELRPCSNTTDLIN
uniref:Putative pancreatic triacylglycerol lipase n=1 Tax=Panstrongylus lignarius TaxID=156445 RepID=A0A224XLV6_9HEMI